MTPVERLRRRAGALKGAMRRGRDRILHPRRHAQARQQLRGIERPRTIVVVCLGNVCRSPYLASVLARLLPDVKVESAGLLEGGRSAPEEAVAAAAKRGIDLTPHRSRPLTRDITRVADVAVVMDVRQARALERQGMDLARIVVAGDLDPEPSDQRTIDDPWGKPLDAFEMSYARLDRCALVLVESLRGQVR